MSLYPIKFQPIFKKKIWGGGLLKSKLNKDCPSRFMGESWEISGLPGSETFVSHGLHKGYTLKDLVKAYGAKLVGNSVYKKFGDEFPLLIKFIDAKLPLSIQVHPTEAIAQKRHQSMAKNEMWYIIEAKPSAELLLGFSSPLNKTTYLNRVKHQNLVEVLNKEPVEKGNSFYIPAGEVHAIGGGILLAEIQLAVDITYRIYDFERIDEKGNKRMLHNDLAIDTINFDSSRIKKNKLSASAIMDNNLFSAVPFIVQKLVIKSKQILNLPLTDSFIILMCICGNVDLVCDRHLENLKTGETILIPAAIKKLVLVAHQVEMLIVKMP